MALRAGAGQAVAAWCEEMGAASLEEASNSTILVVSGVHVSWSLLFPVYLPRGRR